MSGPGNIAPPLIAERPTEAEARLWRLGVGASLALAVIVRLVNFAGPSLWADEASSVKVALHQLVDIVGRSRDLTPPLYYVLLHAWVSVFGPSAAAIRSLSVVLGVGAVALLGWIARRLVGTRPAIVAMALLAVSPMAVFYSQMARSYSLFLVLSIASFGLLIRWEEHGRTVDALAWLATTTAMAYTHNYWVFNFAAQQAYVLVGIYRRRVRLRAWLVMTAGIVVLFGPWLLPLFRRTGRYAQYQSVVGPPDLGELFHAVQQWVVWKDLAPGAGIDLAGLLSLPFAVLALHGLVRLIGRLPLKVVTFLDARAALLLALWVSLPVLTPWTWSHVATRIFDQPYVIAAAPAYMVLVARGLSDLPWRAARVVVVVFAIGVALANMWAMATREAKQDWPEAAALLAAAGPDDVVMVSSPYHEIVLAYYWKGPTSVVTYKPPVSGYSVESRLVVGISAARERRARLWFVAMYPRHKDQALELVHEQAPCAALSLSRGLRGFTVLAFDFSGCG